MKTKPRRYHPGLILSFAALLSALPALVIAEDAAPAPPPPEHRRERGPDLERIAAELGLNDDQKAKMKALLEQERTEMESLKADASVAKEDKRAKGMEIHKKYRDLRDAVLTPEQRAKQKAMMEKRRAEHGDKGGPPPADQK
jgi:Spy/CpxP family protein refolding chaperone